MRRAVTARFRWKTCCPQSSLSLELSGEAKEIRLSLSVKLMLNFSIAEVACKQTLIATRCLLAALMIEHAQGIKVTGRFFFFKVIFRPSLVHVIGYRVERQEIWLVGALTLQSYVK